MKYKQGTRVIFGKTNKIDPPVARLLKKIERGSPNDSLLKPHLTSGCCPYCKDSREVLEQNCILLSESGWALRCLNMD